MLPGALNYPCHSTVRPVPSSGGYAAVLSRLLPFDTLRAFNLESADSIVEHHHRLPKDDKYRGSHVEVWGGSKAFSLRHQLPEDILYTRTVLSTWQERKTEENGEDEVWPNGR